MDEQKLFTSKQAAAAMGIGYGTLRNLLADGKVGYVKAGHRTMVTQAAMDEYRNRPFCARVTSTHPTSRDPRCECHDCTQARWLLANWGMPRQ